MSIASRIQAIEQHLTDDYNVLEVAGADLTNVDKNILNLKSTWQERLLYFMNNGTDVVWNNWDKVTGEGTSISLNNTLEGKMKINLKGNTSQEGTPTPEAPQDIHVVSGDNSINVCGKNLFDGTPFVSCNSGQGYINKLNGQATTISSDNNNVTFKVDYAYGGLESNYIPVKANETYTLNLEGTNIGNRFFITQYDNSKTRISTLNNVAMFSFPLTFTTTNNGYITIANTNTSVPSSNCILKNIQLEKGSQATTYEEYKSASYPITLPEGMFLGWIPNTDYRDKIDKSSGKNLVETINIYNGYPVKSIGSVITYNSSANSITYIKCAYVNANKTYTLSWDYATPKATGNRDIIICDDNKIELEFFSYSNLNNKSYTFTPTHNGWIYASLDTNAINVMLNEGTTALPYEPYGTRWYVKKEIGKVVLDGSENWTTNSGWHYTNTGIYILNQNPKTTEQVYSDKFFFYRSAYANDINGEVGIVWGSTLSFRILKTIASDTEAFKTWLSTHNTIVYYVLATPTYTEITDSTLLSQLNALAKSYTGQTNISQESNDLASILNATALREMA